MKHCKCGAIIADKYIYCAECATKERDKKPDSLEKISTQLEHINWNLGKIVGYMTKNTKLIKDIQKAEHDKKRVVKDEQ